MSIIWLQKTL